MASLQSRISDLITAIGADIKNTNQVQSITSSSTPTPTGFANRNTLMVSAQAVTATFGAPSGTPVQGNSLIIRVKDNGGAATLNWNAIYRSLDTSNVPLPTTTVAGKWMYIGFVYNATDSKWDLVSVLAQT